MVTGSKPKTGLRYPNPANQHLRCGARNYGIFVRPKPRSGAVAENSNLQRVVRLRLEGLSHRFVSVWRGGMLRLLDGAEIDNQCADSSWVQPQGRHVGVPDSYALHQFLFQYVFVISRQYMPEYWRVGPRTGTDFTDCMASAALPRGEQAPVFALCSRVVVNLWCALHLGCHHAKR